MQFLKYSFEESQRRLNATHFYLFSNACKGLQSAIFLKLIYCYSDPNGISSSPHPGDLNRGAFCTNTRQSKTLFKYIPVEFEEVTWRYI